MSNDNPEILDSVPPMRFARSRCHGEPSNDKDRARSASFDKHSMIDAAHGRRQCAVRMLWGTFASDMASGALLLTLMRHFCFNGRELTHTRRTLYYEQARARRLHADTAPLNELKATAADLHRRLLEREKEHTAVQEELKLARSTVQDQDACGRWRLVWRKLKRRRGPSRKSLPVCGDS